MDGGKEALLKKLSDCVVNMEDELVVDIAQEYVHKGYDPKDGMLLGLADGMNRASMLYEEEEYYIPELLICSDAMYNGIDVLKKYIPVSEEEDRKVKIVIGVVYGDTHDIGKNLVKIMLETAGFDVYDLGRDVPCDKFIEKAVEIDAQLLCLSTLMTTTMPEMQRIIDKLKEKKLKDKVKVMIGGGPISQGFADKIGADGYSTTAVEAVRLAKRLVEV